MFELVKNLPNFNRKCHIISPYFDVNFINVYGIFSSCIFIKAKAVSYTIKIYLLSQMSSTEDTQFYTEVTYYYLEMALYCQFLNNDVLNILKGSNCNF